LQSIGYLLVVVQPVAGQRLAEESQQEDGSEEQAQTVVAQKALVALTLFGRPESVIAAVTRRR
jgi:hypothetical protein